MRPNTSYSHPRLIDEDDIEGYQWRRPSTEDDEEDDSPLRERPDEEGRFEAGVSREDFDLMRL